MTRSECLAIIAALPAETREAIAVFVETAETQGDYSGCDEDGASFWMDDVNATLLALANEIRSAH